MFSSVGCMDMKLFEKFSFHELTENMRQSDDQTFQDLLNRSRIGCLNEDDVRVLNERVVERLPEESKTECAARAICRLMEVDKAAVCLMPYVDAASEVNRKVMEVLKLKTVTIKVIECNWKSLLKEK